MEIETEHLATISIVKETEGNGIILKWDDTVSFFEGTQEGFDRAMKVLADVIGDGVSQ